MVVVLSTQSILIIPPNFPNLTNCNKLIAKNIISVGNLEKMTPESQLCISKRGENYKSEHIH